MTLSLRSVLGPPVQIAYAVQDAERAAHDFAIRFGAGPFVLRRHIPLTDVRYLGEPSSFDHTSAYGQWGDVMVELVQDHTVGASPVRDVVGAGREGLHHHAHFVTDFDDAQVALHTAGFPELFVANAGGTRFAFHDARVALGHMIEIYPASDRLRGFYAMVRESAQNWDGSNPVREL